MRFVEETDGKSFVQVNDGSKKDEKVIYSAINFWFKDEDAGTGKVWNYFKEI